MHFMQSVTLMAMATLYLAACASNKTELIVPMTAMRKLTGENKFCFEKYDNWKLHISKQYRNDLEECDREAQEERQTIGDTTFDIRSELSYTIDRTCTVINSCRQAGPAEDVFSCFAEEGTKSAKHLQGISSNASKSLIDLNESLRVVESKEAKCETASKETFEKDGYAAQDSLGDCLATGVWSGANVTDVPPPLHHVRSKTISHKKKSIKDKALDMIASIKNDHSSED